MDVHVEVIGDFAVARAMAPGLESLAAQAVSEFRDEPMVAGAVARLLERSFDRPETVLLRADARGADTGSGPLGILPTAPLEDPLSGERLPLIVLLHVEPRSRHRGIAGRLVEAATRELARRGLECLAARAGHNDDALISMGERWGFVRHWDLMLRE
jgi:GNAT superfamily N-acetyltransferase